MFVQSRADAFLQEETTMTVQQTIQIDAIPQSIEEFVALRDKIAGTPEGGATMMVVALLAYAEDEQLGQQCLTVAVDRGRLQEGAKGYKGWQLRNTDLQRIRTQLKGSAYLPKSYVQGATPENRYQMPGPPYVFGFSGNPYSGDPSTGTYKTFIASSGAASARPVTLKRNDKGIWKASEWSSLVVGVQAPEQDTSDDL